jgi:predicted transcriptional regulator of viral defense system
MKPGKGSLPAHRARLAAVLRAAKEVVSVDIVSGTLGMERRAAAKLLSRWKQQGWLRRIGHGLYVPVPLDLAGSETEGYARLDPALPPKKLATAWHLWLPSARK